MTEQTERTAHDLTTRELTAQLSEQLSRLLRDEIALAKAELFASGRQAALGGGMFGGAGLAGHTAWLAMAAAAIAGISVVLPVWAAALIVGGALGAIAGILAMLGKRRFQRSVPPLRMTAETVRQEVSEITARVHSGLDGGRPRG